MLRAAVQENTDLIEGRLPVAFRPARRYLAAWGRHIWLLALPVSFIVASALAAPGPVPASLDEWKPEPAPVVERLPDSMPDLSLLTRPLPPGALGLGVRRVVLDPGHGGDHLGTLSANGLREKDVTLELAERARRLLVERGFEVVLTRTADDTLSLKQRATTANQLRGDIFVSIHLNSLEPASANGIETFYLGPGEHPEHDAIAATENEHSGYSLADMRTLLDGIYVDARRDESKRLAQSVQDAIVKRVRTIDPAITDRGVKTAPFVVLVATEMPAILAEVSCLSNTEEVKRLGTTAYRQSIAEALVLGIQSFAVRNAAPFEKRKGQQ